ncbi:SPOR domain-containing protein [Vibrio alfacsensis]|uniref:SPOR domain-containing protein n=1 Tax=Vibrio alfacsensis TaxID=1074311 RepID=UPI002ADDC815|nr:SPOR domain-containing protein [Vibrio alfacsensis]WQE76275.1 SPOR domain-containing protein [Vibrio alfacsensis]
MEMKKAHLSTRIAKSSLSLGLLLVCAHYSPLAMADSVLCDASQASHSELPMLEQSCPIGKGVWGKKVPQGGNDFFWIQCGLLPKPMPLAKAKPIYSKITTDVWMKKEQSNYRCLIGPYLDFADARADLNRVKTLVDYKEAFIRVVNKSGAKAQKQTKPAPKPVPKPTANKPKVAPKTVAPVTRPDTDAFKDKPAIESKPESAINSSNVELRLETKWQGVTYAVPYFSDNQNQFYMEHGKPWNRLDYPTSEKVCQVMEMKLATVGEFKALRQSGVMEKNRWPMQLPYWGKDRKGLFADREPNQLTGTSLLNVMCVK